MEPSSIKYMYFRDPECPEHVLTVGRTVIDGELTVSYALNKVGPADVAYRKDNYVPRTIVYDRFNKKTARHVVQERLKRPDRRWVVAVEEGQRFYEAVIAFLTNPHWCPLPARTVEIAKAAIAAKVASA